MKEEKKPAETKPTEPMPAKAAEKPVQAEPAQTAPAQTAEDKSLEELQKQAEDFKRKWYSVTAEYENYRRRTASTRAQAYAEGRADVVKGLFPIADTLALALQSCADEKTRHGIEMVNKAFEKLLEEEDIEVIDPLGEEFDANKCEAVFAVDGEKGEQSGTVKQVLRKGYEQKGKILRFAQVSVIK